MFYGKAQALGDVSIHVHEREFVSVVGLNGAGKTTLFNAISGLIPYSGQIDWGGQSLAGRSGAAIARGGIVHCPETRELFGDMSVRENLDLGGQHQTPAERARQLEWLFDLFPRLKEREGQNAATMSGGEQQMLAIARALMSRPRLLLLDEPSLGLAPLIVTDVMETIVRIARTGTTVLLVEQNAHLALQIASRAYVLETGRVALSGAAATLLASEEMRRAYLGSAVRV